MLKKTPRSIKLPEWLWLKIDAVPGANRALVIEDALSRVYGWQAPENLEESDE
jgi:hypothetical protein